MSSSNSSRAQNSSTVQLSNEVYRVQHAYADGNCAFNGFILGLSNPVVLNKIQLDDNNSFVMEASAALGLASTSWEELKKELIRLQNEPRQLELKLSPIAQHLAIEYIQAHPDAHLNESLEASIQVELDTYFDIRSKCKLFAQDRIIFNKFNDLYNTFGVLDDNELLHSALEDLEYFWKGTAEQGYQQQEGAWVKFMHRNKNYQVSNPADTSLIKAELIKFFKMGGSGDTFSQHPFILDKFQELYTKNQNKEKAKEELIHWWKNQDGYNQFLNALKIPATKGDRAKHAGPMELKALGAVFKVNVSSCTNQPNSRVPLHIVSDNANAPTILLRNEDNHWDPLIPQQPSSVSTHNASTESASSKSESTSSMQPAATNLPSTNHFHSPLTSAAAANDIDTVVKLLQQPDTNVNWQGIWGNTALHWAIANTNTKMASLLLNQAPAIDVNIQDDAGKTALHMAIAKGLYHFDDTGRNEPPQMVNIETLIKKTNLTIQDNFGNTPLHIAVIRRDIPVIELLLQYDANLEVKNNEDKKPFQMIDMTFNEADRFLTDYIIVITLNQALWTGNEERTRELLNRHFTVINTNASSTASTASENTITSPAAATPAALASPRSVKNLFHILDEATLLPEERFNIALQALTEIQKSNKEHAYILTTNFTYDTNTKKITLETISPVDPDLWTDMAQNDNLSLANLIFDLFGMDKNPPHTVDRNRLDRNAPNNITNEQRQRLAKLAENIKNNLISFENATNELKAIHLSESPIIKKTIDPSHEIAKKYMKEFITKIYQKVGSEKTQEMANAIPKEMSLKDVTEYANKKDEPTKNKADTTAIKNKCLYYAGFLLHEFYQDKIPFETLTHTLNQLSQKLENIAHKGILSSIFKNPSDSAVLLQSCIQELENTQTKASKPKHNSKKS